MTRKQAKELLPIIQAFAEGKTIQIKWNNNEWVDIEKDDTLSLVRILECRSNFRIKPEPKYRPFKNADECWAEMQKHQPFGWLKRIGDNEYNLLTDVDGSVECEGVRIDGDGYFWDMANNEYTFADGTPFGIKEGE